MELKSNTGLWLSDQSNLLPFDFKLAVKIYVRKNTFQKAQFSMGTHRL